MSDRDEILAYLGLPAGATFSEIEQAYIRRCNSASERLAAGDESARVELAVLEEVYGRLTGRMVDQAWGDICDGEEKRTMLLETCALLGISPRQAIAMGDGANDLPMMGEVGLSVAFHAKSAVREFANVCINSGGLDRLLTIFQSWTLVSLRQVGSGTLGKPASAIANSLSS